jgi:hypothetical protein
VSATRPSEVSRTQPDDTSTPPPAPAPESAAPASARPVSAIASAAPASVSAPGRTSAPAARAVSAATPASASAPAPAGLSRTEARNVRDFIQESILRPLAECCGSERSGVTTSLLSLIHGSADLAPYAEQLRQHVVALLDFNPIGQLRADSSSGEPLVAIAASSGVARQACGVFPSDRRVALRDFLFECVAAAVNHFLGSATGDVHSVMVGLQPVPLRSSLLCRPSSVNGGSVQLVFRGSLRDLHDGMLGGASSAAGMSQREQSLDNYVLSRLCIAMQKAFEIPTRIEDPGMCVRGEQALCACALACTVV